MCSERHACTWALKATTNVEQCTLCLSVSATLAAQRTALTSSCSHVRGSSFKLLAPGRGDCATHPTKRPLVCDLFACLSHLEASLVAWRTLATQSAARFAGLWFEVVPSLPTGWLGNHARVAALHNSESGCNVAVSIRASAPPKQTVPSQAPQA